MKSSALKYISVVLCLCLLFGLTACKSKKENSVTSDPLNGLDVEFKFSKDFSSWTGIKADSELFRADGKYSAGDVEIVYLNIKNQTNSDINYKLNFSVSSGKSDGVMFGFAEDVRSAFADSSAAVTTVEETSKAVGSGFTWSKILKPESVITLALVVYSPDTAAEMKIKTSVSALAVSSLENGNTSTRENGDITVFADCYSIATEGDTVVVNADASFKATVKAGVLAEGSLLAAKVTPKDGGYDIKLTVDGKDYTGGAEISLLIGYGYQSVEVLLNGNKVNFSYGMYDGRVVFNVTANGVYTVAKSNKIDIKGVVVNGVSRESENVFTSFDEAIEYVVGLPVSDVEENITYFIFGEVKYLVEEGEMISFTGDNAKIKSVSVIGATEDATLIIDGMSGSLPSLPAAEKGVKISYSDLLMNSEKQDDYRCFDYRGNADITFKNCTFKRALAARGPQSNVVVDGCTFACETVEDTHKGYCYYSIPIIGSDVIRVEFINNQVTKSWGGINIDWGDAEFYIAGNTFSNINCSKPAIQLSRARSVVIEKNKFTNIKDENAFRFYSGYAAGSTHILDNEIDVDYLFHSDYVDAINNYNDFVFKGNVISSRTNLTIGHITNLTPDQVREHGYVVDETLNTIE